MRSNLRIAVATPPTQPVPPHNSAPPVPDPQEPGLSVKVPIEAIDPNPWNPRVFPAHPTPDDASLTASITRFGVQENLLVRPGQTADRYQLIFGERRLRCARAAGLTAVPAVVRSMDDHEARTLTLTENLLRRQLTFLEEADAVAGLVEEKWSLQQVADELGKPISWVARRRRLLGLTDAWRRLAERREGFTANWNAGDFEQIALLESDAQADLLTHHRHSLERCTSARQLAQLVRSLTCTLGSFRWDLDDADLHPVAGACSACPYRSSQNPGLFDDQPSADAPGTLDNEAKRRPLADRCLNPLCATKKAQLYLDRKVATLAAKHPRVHLLQEGHSPNPIPGALRDWQIDEVKKSTPGAEPLVVANGPRLGRIRWIKPRAHPLRVSPESSRPNAPRQKASLAERQLRLQRRRKIHALDLAKTVLAAHPAPPLSTCIRLTIAFGTAHINASSEFHPNSGLPNLQSGVSLAAERRCILESVAPSITADATARLESELETTEARDADVFDANESKEEDEEESENPSATAKCSSRQPSETSNPWRIFDTLDEAPDSWPELLWARLRPVLLGRMTPNDAPSHADAAWNEALRILPLAGLDSQPFLDQALAALPDPKSWAKEIAAATVSELSVSSVLSTLSDARIEAA